ncbi:hypothetical protein ACC759_38130, partial [Rhizobium ruizarguesonis]
LAFAAKGTTAGQSGYVASADANHDGRIDSADTQLLFQNLVYRPNQGPVVSAGSFKTHEDLTLAADVGAIASDPEGDQTFYRV